MLNKDNLDAKKIIVDKCIEHNSLLIPGQVKWIVEAMEEYARIKGDQSVKPVTALDYDFIVRVMLSMTEHSDLLPVNIRDEKAKLSMWYNEFYYKKESHILARVKWLKEYVESHFPV